MIPLKLMTRSVTRSTASLLLPQTSFHTGALILRTPQRTTPALALEVRSSVSKSNQFAYSTEAIKPDIKESLESKLSQPPPPVPESSSPQTENTKNKKGEKDEIILTPRQEVAEKILADKLYKSIELEVLSYEPAVLDSYQWFVLTAATHLGITVGKCWSPLKSDKHRFQVLKSAFVHKKHQVHYEIRTYHRFLTFHKLTGSTADTFLEYIERNTPEGVGMKVTRVEVQALPDYLQKQ